MCCNFAFAHGLRELAYFREKFCLEAADQRNIRSRLHAELLNARLWMKDLVTPLCRGRAEMKDCKSIRSLQAEFAVHCFRRFDRGERNLQPEVATEENLARFEQCPSFCLLLAERGHAFHFVSHGGSPPIASLFRKPNCSF